MRISIKKALITMLASILFFMSVCAIGINEVEAKPSLKPYYDSRYGILTKQERLPTAATRYVYTKITKGPSYAGEYTTDWEKQTKIIANSSDVEIDPICGDLKGWSVTIRGYAELAGIPIAELTHVGLEGNFSYYDFKFEAYSTKIPPHSYAALYVRERYEVYTVECIETTITEGLNEDKIVQTQLSKEIMLPNTEVSEAAQYFISDKRSDFKQTMDEINGARSGYEYIEDNCTQHCNR